VTAWLSRPDDLFCPEKSSHATIPKNLGQDKWPSDQALDTAFAWPAHEPKYESYTGWTPVQVILNEHFQDLTKAQDAVFWLLVNDISEVRDEQFSDDRTV
jgi:hypothetical protein